MIRSVQLCPTLCSPMDCSTLGFPNTSIVLFPLYNINFSPSPSQYRLNTHYASVQFSSVAQSCPTLRPHGLQHATPPCPSPTPRACSNSCPLSWRCHPTISSSVIPFSSCLQSFPASGSFPVSQFFALGGQSIGVSASTSVLPMNIPD